MSTVSAWPRRRPSIYLDLRGTAPILTWKGCVLLQQDSYHDSVARLTDGGFVTTRMRDQNFRGGGGAPGGITGHLVEWHPGGKPQPLPDTEMSLPNGIDVSKDERYIYVAAIGSQELVRFQWQASDRRSQLCPACGVQRRWLRHGLVGARSRLGDVGLLATRRRGSHGRDAARELGHPGGRRHLGW